MGYIEAYKKLSEISVVNLSFGVHTKEKEKIHNILNNVTSIIKSMQSFNEKNNEQIARDFEEFFEALPKKYYNENNPNNDLPIFDTIELVKDDTILLHSFGTLSEEKINEIELIVNEYGRRWQADDKMLLKRETGIGDFSEYTIRLWWD